MHFQAEGYGTEGFVATANQTPEAQTADLKPVGSRCKWMFGQVIAYITSCEHKQLYCTGFCKIFFVATKNMLLLFFPFAKRLFKTSESRVQHLRRTAVVDKEFTSFISPDF